MRLTYVYGECSPHWTFLSEIVPQAVRCGCQSSCNCSSGKTKQNDRPFLIVCCKCEGVHTHRLLDCLSIVQDRQKRKHYIAIGLWSAMKITRQECSVPLAACLATEETGLQAVGLECYIASTFLAGWGSLLIFYSHSAYGAAAAHLYMLTLSLSFWHYSTC